MKHLCQLPGSLLLLIAAVLAGCASYAPKPLPRQSSTVANAAQLIGASASQQPWDLPTLEKLVLLNNPDLRTLRAQHQIAHAQMLQAGLLPDPAFSGSLGYLLSGPGDATAWAASLTEDVTALITLKPRRAAYEANFQAIDAQLLWQEWQIVAKAQLLMVDLVEGRRLYQAQLADTALLEQRRARIQRAIDQGLLDRATSGPELAVTADAEATTEDLAQHLLDLQQQLCALLGLRPDAALPLPSTLVLPAWNAGDVQQEAATVAQRRPDLIALQLGYRAQEANVRAQILAQFPGLSLGYATASDNSRVYNAGPAISFQLPLFDRNQHGIAAAVATRDQLWLEYGNRLAQAHDAIAALTAQYQLGSEQYQQLAVALSRDRGTQHNELAWREKDIDLHTYADLSHEAFGVRGRLLALEQAQMERQIALQTLLGSGMPDALPTAVTAP
ncbi:TolC family protein [Dyella jejuensis]|uniref:TolC family protein n=1 Tax=Dyella jejuensis TaxID=1432009 RepID=A0ABW8JL75_9GAMM